MLTYIHDPSKDMHRDMAAEIYLCDEDYVNKQLRNATKGRFVFAEFYGSYWEKVGPDLWDAIDLLHLTIDKGDKKIDAKKWLTKKGITQLGGGKIPPPDSFMAHVKRVESNFWNKRFPIYDKWRKKWYQDYLLNGGYRTLTGFYIQGMYSRNDVINHPVQGAAFHCLLWSLIELQKELRQRRMKSKVVGQIHDSIVGDVVEKEFEKYLQISKEIMTERIREHWDWLIVPLGIEAEATELGETWFDKKGVKLAT